MKLAVISDIHSNLPALEAVLEAIEKDGGVDGYLCAGDIVGYGPFPNECVARIRSLRNLHAVQGNHDYVVVSGSFHGLSEDAELSLSWTQGELTDENRAFLSALEPSYEAGLEGKKISMVHGSPFDPLHEYVEYDMPPDIMESMLFENDLLVLGHTHVPMIKTFYGRGGEKRPGSAGTIASQLSKLEKRYIFNSGSVGQPRDGDARAGFGIVKLDEKGVFCKAARTAYDIERTANAMREKGLPESLAQRLFLGK